MRATSTGVCLRTWRVGECRDAPPGRVPVAANQLRAWLNEVCLGVGGYRRRNSIAVGEGIGAAKKNDDLRGCSRDRESVAEGIGTEDCSEIVPVPSFGGRYRAGAP